MLWRNKWTVPKKIADEKLQDSFNWKKLRRQSFPEAPMSERKDLKDREVFWSMKLNAYFNFRNMKDRDGFNLILKKKK